MVFFAAARIGLAEGWVWIMLHRLVKCGASMDRRIGLGMAHRSELTLEGC